MLRLDHVVLGVRDLVQAEKMLWHRCGLASVEGGSHPKRGTANRLVPVGHEYVELLSIVNPEAAARHPRARWLARHVRDRDRFIAWCVSTDDIDAVASRCGVVPVSGSRVHPDGTRVTFRVAGFEAAVAESLPFFISWDDSRLRLGAVRPQHRVDPVGIEWIEVGGDARRLETWLGDADLPIRIMNRPPGLYGIGIGTTTGEIVLR